MTILPAEHIIHHCLIPKKLYSIEIFGTTFLYFYANETEHKDVYIGDNTILEHFLNFCDKLQNNIDLNTYYPNRLEELFLSELATQKKLIQAYFHSYNDSNGLLSYDKESILSSLQLFIMEYGFSDHWVCEHIDKNIKKAITSEIRKIDTEHDPKTFIHLCCVNELLENFFDIFMRYKEPALYTNNANNRQLRPDNVTYHTIIATRGLSVGVHSSIDIGSYYDTIQNKWFFKYSIRTLYDFIGYALITSTSRKEYINKCPNCGRYYTTKNEKAVYCSPTCRNRANVRKNYEKKKRGEINGNSTKEG